MTIGTAFVFAVALAILLHAVYNAYIFLKGHAGYGF